MTTPDLLSRSRDFRRNILFPNGGWLYDVVVGISNMTGLSDYFLLGIIFIASWIILRIVDREVSLVLGLGFDLTIPLEHYHVNVKAQHVKHMEQYWPVFFTGVAIEFGCLFFIHPSIFTLIVCLKTTFCTAIWFMQGSDLAAPAPAPAAAAAAPQTTSHPQPPQQSSGDSAPKQGPGDAEQAVVMKCAEALHASGKYNEEECFALANKITQQKDKSRIPQSLDKRVKAEGDALAAVKKDAAEILEEMKKRSKQGGGD